MMEKQSVFSGKRHGFTLVELIVVIVVIAIIAAIAVPRITSFQDSARKARIQTEHRELVTAIQMYRANHPEAMPETVDFSKIAPYMSNNGQGTTAAALLATLAKNDQSEAHQIDSTTGILTSTFVPASGTSTTWTYTFK